MFSSLKKSVSSSASDLKQVLTSLGQSLTLAEPGNLFLLVRHRGCTFCRESLDGLSKFRKQIEDKGLRPVVVHMGDSLSGELMAEEFALQGIPFISDPERALYQVLGARRGSLFEVLGPQVVKNALAKGSLLKYGIGKLEGDGFQLGGLYLIQASGVRCLHRPQDASDVEPWQEILQQLPTFK
jgi:hypothetical protein